MSLHSICSFSTPNFQQNCLETTIEFQFNGGRYGLQDKLNNGYLHCGLGENSSTVERNPIPLPWKSENTFEDFTGWCNTADIYGSYSSPFLSFSWTQSLDGPLAKDQLPPFPVVAGIKSQHEPRSSKLVVFFQFNESQLGMQVLGSTAPVS